MGAPLADTAARLLEALDDLRHVRGAEKQRIRDTLAGLGQLQEPAIPHGHAPPDYPVEFQFLSRLCCRFLGGGQGTTVRVWGLAMRLCL